MSKPFAKRKFTVGAQISVSVIALAVVAATAVAAGARPHSQTAALKSVAAAKSPASVPSAGQTSRVRATLAALPLAFEANQGQTDPQVKYLARGNGYTLFLTSSKAVMTLPGRKRQSEVRDMMMNKRRGAAGVKAMLKKRAASRTYTSPMAVLQMNFLGANVHSQLAAEDFQPGQVNYFIGKDRSKWHADIPLYGRVNYSGLYPGVDLAFHGASNHLEFDYLVSPHADAAAIALGFQGSDSLQTDAVGNLVLTTSAGPVQLNKPVAYQTKNGVRQLVNAGFVLKGKNRVGFSLGSYDHNRELVIDPTVTYSTYFGGDSADYGIGIAVDASGNSYVAGATDSSTIPGPGSSTVSPANGGFDTFVTKIAPTGTCIFTTFFGGANDDFPGGIAIDSQGIYIAGTTDSADFPATSGAAQTLFLGGVTNGNNDAYAVKLALSNGALIWGSFVGGSDSDSGLGVAVDSSHNVYVVGETFSQDLGGALGGVNPLPNGSALNLNSGSGNDDGYIVKLNSGGTAYSLVSYLGGSNGDLATGVALDASGNIYVSGVTISTDLPVTGGVVQSTCGSDGNCNSGQDDAFVTAIASNLSGYNYWTYYGGSGADNALGISADSSGNAYITGSTTSSDFPTGGTPFQGSLAGTQNAFLVELNSAGSSVTYGSYFGGNGQDIGLGITLDSSTPPNAYITGQTTSSTTTFPLVNPTQASLSGSSDAFVSVFGLSQGQVLFSTFLGGGGDEDQFAGSISLDAAENIYVTGDTDSGNGSTAAFPTTAGAIDTTYGGGTCLKSSNLNVPCTDAFVTAYGPATAPDFTIAATPLSPASVAPGSSATSTVTVTPLNGFADTVNLTCAVTGGGSPAPTCSLNPTSGNSSTLTVATTGAAAAGSMSREPSVFYALWLPVVGLSLIGMRFSTTNSRRKRLLGFLLLGLIMAALFFLPACGGSSSNGGGGGCSGCTPAGSYTVTVTGTDASNANLAHSVSPALTLTVN